MSTTTEKPNVPTTKLIRARQVTRDFGIPYTSLRDIAHRGELPVIRIGRAWYFERADIDHWIQTRKGTAA